MSDSVGDGLLLPSTKRPRMPIALPSFKPLFGEEGVQLQPVAVQTAGLQST